MKANDNPRNKFKMLLVILTIIALSLGVLFMAAFGALQLAQDYGIIDVSFDDFSLEDWYETDAVAAEAGDGDSDSVSVYQPVSAIESITMENFMEDA